MMEMIVPSIYPSTLWPKSAGENNETMVKESGCLFGIFEIPLNMNIL